MENRLCEEARLMRAELAAAKIDDSSSTKADLKVADEQRRQKEKREADPRPALNDLGWSKKEEKDWSIFWTWEAEIRCCGGLLCLFLK